MENAGMNKAWIDIEFTSFRRNDAAIIEIAIIPEIDGERLEPFHSFIRPHQGADINPRTLEFLKVKRETLDTYPEPSVVAFKMLTYLEKIGRRLVLSGHNVSGADHAILKMFFMRNQMGTAFMDFFHPTNMHDTLVIARRLKKHIPTEDMKLETLYKYFTGKPLISAHTALADIEANVVVGRYLEAIENPVQESIIQAPSELTELQKRAKYIQPDYFQVGPKGDVYISPKAVRDKDAMEFIINELHGMFIDEV